MLGYVGILLFIRLLSLLLKDGGLSMEFKIEPSKSIFYNSNLFSTIRKITFLSQTNSQNYTPISHHSKLIIYGNGTFLPPGPLLSYDIRFKRQITLPVLPSSTI
jgi:hypothetical protein